MFASRRATIVFKLSKALSRIHYTFDIWSSGNHRSYLAVVAHWLDEDGTVRQGVLGLRQLLGDHSGQSIAAIVWAILEDFDLQNNTGYCILDNAKNNDTALVSLRQYFLNINIDWDNSECRLRCFGHILNITAQAFLHGDDLDAFEAENTQLDEEEQHELWRKRGSFGKLRNIIVKINSSPQRRLEFVEVQKRIQAGVVGGEPLALISGNKTRWNGDYLSIERARRYRDAIDYFVSLHSARKATKHFDLTGDSLTDSDWEELGYI